jgi:hypothetical protein
MFERPQISRVDDPIPERMARIATRMRQRRGSLGSFSSSSPLPPSSPEFDASPDSSTKPDPAIMRTPARKQLLLPRRAAMVVFVWVRVSEHQIEGNRQQGQQTERKHDDEADREQERHEGPEIPWR